tara:strand:- start:11189 stop:11479 length:291 start_codon:yes stop_codon:yes gene_type:complete
MQVINLTQEELTHLLERAAEKGAARAIKMQAKTSNAEWVPLQVALDVLCVSARTLARYVEAGYIRKNSKSQRAKSYYSLKDIEAYKAGVHVINKPR